MPKLPNRRELGIGWVGLGSGREREAFGATLCVYLVEHDMERNSPFMCGMLAQRHADSG